MHCENVSDSKEVEDLIKEDKCQKIICITDKSADGWKVIEEYVSDELASGYLAEKQLKKAKKAASRNRKQTA